MKADSVLPTITLHSSHISGIAGNWRIIKPIPIEVKLTPDYFIVSDDIFLEYGIGETLTEAQNDYLISLGTYADIIEEHARPENVPTQIQLEQVYEYLERNTNG